MAWCRTGNRPWLIGDPAHRCMYALPSLEESVGTVDKSLDKSCIIFQSDNILVEKYAICYMRDHNSTEQNYSTHRHPLHPHQSPIKITMGYIFQRYEIYANQACWNFLKPIWSHFARISMVLSMKQTHMRQNVHARLSDWGPHKMVRIARKIFKCMFFGKKVWLFMCIYESQHWFW